ncbi:MAG: putative transposase [Paraglaciecola sp.]
MNPVRAGIVDDPAHYSWSSYQCNGLGKTSKLLSPHPLYQKLGETCEERTFACRELFKHQIGGKLLDNIRKAANKDLVLGSERFVEEVEALTGKSLKEGKRGRPRGWRKAVKTD